MSFDEVHNQSPPLPAAPQQYHAQQPQRFATAASPLLPPRHGPAQPPAITTALSNVQSRSVWSASTTESPRSPFVSAGPSPLSRVPWSNSRVSSPMAHRTPATVVTDYNPQQWGRSGPTLGEYRPHATVTADVSDGAIPSPPPPYSPRDPQENPFHPGTAAQSQGHNLPSLQTALLSPVSNLGEYASPMSAMSVASPMGQILSRQLPAQQSLVTPSTATGPPPSFPPPPNATRDRSSSRNRDGQRSMFSLSALRNRSADRATTPNAMEALRQNTSEALQRAPVPHAPTATQAVARRQLETAGNRMSMYVSNDAVVAPPSSRRSASTGGIVAHTPVRHTSNQHGGEAPLPPPPPGPPPNGYRSVSHDRAPANVPTLPMPTRRPPQRGTALGPVPPTPADWSESTQQPSAPRSRSPLPRLDTTNVQQTEQVPPLRIQTGQRNNERDSSPAPDSQPRSSNDASSSLPIVSRTDTGSSKGIRERRNESRAAKDRAGLPSESTPATDPAELASVKPSDLNLTSPPGSGGGISRQKAVKRSRASTSPTEPRLQSRQMGKRPVGPDSASTPPFSGRSEYFQNGSKYAEAGSSTSKALPTPPPQRTSSGLLSPSHLAGLKSLDRPISHIFHTPNSDVITTPPLVPPPTENLADTLHDVENEKNAFAKASLQRYQAFIQKERVAADDRERLELFAEFIVAESRTRRDRYSAAFAEMAGDVMELTRDLWRSHQPSPTTAIHSAKTPPPSSTNASSIPRKNSIDSYASASSPISSRANFTPRTESESPSEGVSAGGSRENMPWVSYKPVLSPIPSMAMSAQDEELSRGRPASRWWESSTGSIGGSQRLERSKRESKFMGVSREARYNLQYEDQHSPHHGISTTPKRDDRAGASEYPPEKVGWHEEASEDGHPRSTPNQQQFWSHSAPNTPDPHGLDVSRLVTLPPPYPRHYPAMANNHPDLASIRNTLRWVSDLEEVKTTKEAFHNKIVEQRQQEMDAAAARREQMQRNIQEQLQLGQMTYASAASAEADFNANEARIKQQVVKREFDAYQPEVMTPLHAFLSERVTKASACIAQLKAGLSDAAVDPTQRQPQEEGDEQPELLEKLNLLKWLFEAREHLHKELFELEGERNECYRAVIITPMREAGQEDKLANAESFFRRDRCERKASYQKAALARFESFEACIETHVSRGVEDQLNAFWDIAPGLLAVVQRIPEAAAALDSFAIRIPPAEFDDNPAYRDHPLQYLYTLLSHAEKSAYQFIESQTNLLCLLHEAMTGVMVAGLRLVETQRVDDDGEDAAVVMREMSELRRAEEERLTNDLKEKVATVESQWREALGGGLLGAKERVARYLVETGGWDDGLDE